MDHETAIFVEEGERFIASIREIHFGDPYEPTIVVTFRRPHDRIGTVKFFIDDESTLIELVNTLRSSYEKLLKERGIKK